MKENLFLYIMLLNYTLISSIGFFFAFLKLTNSESQSIHYTFFYTFLMLLVSTCIFFYEQHLHKKEFKKKKKNLKKINQKEIKDKEFLDNELDFIIN